MGTVRALLAAIATPDAGAAATAAGNRLAGAYRASLARLREVGVAPIAFPAIRTGIHGPSKDEAARPAVPTRREHGAGLDTAFARSGAATLTPHEKELAA